MQEAVFRLGRVPRFHQTDNSTAATHRIPGGRGCESGESETEGSRKRPFNDEYRALMSHLGMQPRTTVVGAKEQNGDVESHNGVLKRLLEQALLLRGDRDFASRDAWEAFVFEVVLKHNRHCGSRLADELAVMEPLRAKRLPDFERLPHIRVSDWSTVRVKHCAYSVPSRLIGEWVEVRLFEERLEVRFGGVIQLACERLRGRNLHRVDYRHVIWSLVRKPGAFQRYVYREEMFPSVVFRRTYDALTAAGHGVQADLEYLRVLHLAASTLEIEVSSALESLLARGEQPTADAVRGLLRHAQPPPVPAIEVGEVDLKDYDRLLVEVTR